MTMDMKHWIHNAFVVVQPDEQPRHYKAVLSALELDLPENQMRYTATPNAVLTSGTLGCCRD